MTAQIPYDSPSKLYPVDANTQASIKPNLDAEHYMLHKQHEPHHDDSSYNDPTSPHHKYNPTKLPFALNSKPNDLMKNPCHSYIALADFDNPATYGPEYIKLHNGQEVRLLTPPQQNQADHDWSYGSTTQATGWFPTTYITPIYVARADFSTAAEYGPECINLHGGEPVTVLDPPQQDQADHRW